MSGRVGGAAFFFLPEPPTAANVAAISATTPIRLPTTIINNCFWGVMLCHAAPILSILRNVFRDFYSFQRNRLNLDHYG